MDSVSDISFWNPRPTDRQRVSGPSPIPPAKGIKSNRMNFSPVLK